MNSKAELSNGFLFQKGLIELSFQFADPIHPYFF